MRNWNKLQNPFALVGQGFVVGVLLFWVTAPNDAYAAAPASNATASAALPSAA